jgi:hypothetical protein
MGGDRRTYGRHREGVGQGGRKIIQGPAQVRLLCRRLRDPSDKKIGPAPVRGKVSGRVQALLLLEGVSEDSVLFFSGPRFADSVLSASQDWKRHKPFCKADATKSSVPSLNASNDTTEDIVQRATPPKDMNSDKSEGRARGHSTMGRRGTGVMRE